MFIHEIPGWNLDISDFLPKASLFLTGFGMTFESRNQILMHLRYKNPSIVHILDTCREKDTKQPGLVHKNIFL